MLRLYHLYQELIWQVYFFLCLHRCERTQLLSLHCHRVCAILLWPVIEDSRTFELHFDFDWPFNTTFEKGRNRMHQVELFFPFLQQFSVWDCCGRERHPGRAGRDDRAALLAVAAEHGCCWAAELEPPLLHCGVIFSLLHICWWRWCGCARCGGPRPGPAVPSLPASRGGATSTAQPNTAQHCSPVPRHHSPLSHCDIKIPKW